MPGQMTSLKSLYLGYCPGPGCIIICLIHVAVTQSSLLYTCGFVDSFVFSHSGLYRALCVFSCSQNVTLKTTP